MTTTSDAPTKTETPTPRKTPPQASPPPGGRAPSRTRKQVVIAAIVLALLCAASLIMLLTLTGGNEVDANDADVTVLSQSDVTDALLRTGNGPGSMELESLYTPAWYFQWSGRPEPPTDGEPTFAFFLFETTHIEDLPADLPDLAINTASGSFEPKTVSVISDSPHHRVTQLQFPAATADGEPIVDDAASVVVTASWPDGPVQALEWTQPMPFGLGALNTTDSGVTFTMPALSFGAIVAIFSGMFAALTPCMLLLAAYYTAVLSGTAAASVEDKVGTERRLLLTGLTFVGGFTLVYTAGGIVAGYIGESVNRFENVGSYARPVSVIAGIAVVLMGIRMASQARVPVACKLPGFNRPARTGWLGSVIMGSTFAIGCLSCFSATVLTALLLYAGATGSPLTGGLVMLMFSAGTGVMFLLAAVLVARAAPLTEWLAKAQPVIGAVSAVLMIALGILMITYKFHILTGYLFEAWS
jgi:cytochrome c-type biogenesis protein